MSKKSKCKISFTGYREIREDIERLGGDTEKALIEAIEISGKNATNRYHIVTKEHKLTGLTEQSIEDNPKIKKNGYKLVLDTGFNISKGGAPAIWLDRGKPNQKPINFIRKIKKDKAVNGAIGYILGQYWRKSMK